MRLLRLLPLVSLTACAGQSTGSYPAPDRATASHALTAMSTRLESASASINSRASFAPLTGSASATVQCSLGGSLSADGSYDLNDTSERYDLDASFDQCSEREGTIDGALHLEEYVDPTVVRDSADGLIDFTDARGAWSCAFNYSLVIDATSTRYSGMFCGYTVTELDLPN